MSKKSRGKRYFCLICYGNAYGRRTAPFEVCGRCFDKYFMIWELLNKMSKADKEGWLPRI